jgi:virulence-associated protein VapD
LKVQNLQLIAEAARLPASWNLKIWLKPWRFTMSTTTARDARPTPIRHGLPASFKREGVVYAIAFDMDIEQLRVHYGDPYNNAYVEIRRVLEEHQFQWQQSGVYFGGAAGTAATVMVAVIDLTTRQPWFAASVRDIRMLRIEELNDLLPVVQRIAGMTDGGGAA